MSPEGVESFLPCPLEYFIFWHHVIRYVREVPPAHYIFKIEAFSLLKDALAATDKNCIQSTEFYAGGYAW
ncbi:50S ribosomal protein L11 [Bienertia sinuspersici]